MPLLWQPRPWPNSKPDRMARVLISRELLPTHPWRVALESVGHTVVGQSFIQIQSIDFEIPKGIDYGGVIINSPNAAGYFLRKLESPLPILVPGRGTAEACRSLGFEAALIGDGSNMQAFAQAVAAFASGKKILFVSSHQTHGSPIQFLPPLQVFHLPVYTTRPQPIEQLPEVDVTVITSPLNGEGWLLSGGNRSTKVLAIGATTSAYLQSKNTAHKTCASPDAAGILVYL